MPLTDPKQILAARVLHEKQHVTYRLLSRLASIHVAEAKKHLYAFHQDNASTSRAMYLVAGTPLPTPETANGEQATPDDMEVDEQGNKPKEALPTLKIQLVTEDQLKDCKAGLAHIDSIHIYSLGPTYPTTSADLVTANEELDTNPELVKAWKASNNGAKFGLIQIPPRKSGGSSKPTSKKGEPSKPQASTSNASKTKETSKEEAKKDTTSSSSSKAALKRKASAEEVPKPASASTKGKAKVTTSKGKEKTPIKADDDDDESMDEEASIRREQEQADLEAMMEIDWDEEPSILTKPSAGASQAKDKSKDKAPAPAGNKPKAASQEKVKEPSSSAAAPSKGPRKRVRKTRMVKKTVLEDGYKKKFEVEESYSESEGDNEPAPKASSSKASEKPVAKKSEVKKPSSSSAPSAKKVVGKPGQQTSMQSFFKKK